MMARSLKAPINRPDTEAQDQPSLNHRFRLATRGRSIQSGHKQTRAFERRRAVAYGSTRRSLTSAVPANGRPDEPLLEISEYRGANLDAGTGRPK